MHQHGCENDDTDYAERKCSKNIFQVASL
jgi:hypothetical protein